MAKAHAPQEMIESAQGGFATKPALALAIFAPHVWWDYQHGWRTLMYASADRPLRTIGDALTAQNISWAYFGGAYNDAGGTFNLAFDTVTGNTASSNGAALYNQTIAASVKRRFTTATGSIVNWLGSF